MAVRMPASTKACRPCQRTKSLFLFLVYCSRIKCQSADPEIAKRLEDVIEKRKMNVGMVNNGESQSHRYAFLASTISGSTGCDVFWVDISHTPFPLKQLNPGYQFSLWQAV